MISGVGFLTLVRIYNANPAKIFNYVYDIASGISVNPDMYSNGVNPIGCNTPITTTDAFCASLHLKSPHNEQTLRDLIPNTSDPVERAVLLSELLDFLIPQQKENDIIPFLQAINTLDSKRILIPLLINNKMYSEARTEMSTIQMNNLENIDFVNFHSLLCDLGEQGKTCMDIDTNQVQFIRMIANNKSTTLNVNAQAVMSLVFGEQFPISCEMVDDCDISLRKSNNSSNFNDRTQSILSQFNIIPNPLNHNATIQYSSSGAKNSIELNIYDIVGKKLKSFSLDISQNELTINCSDLVNGTYICSLITDGKPGSYQKIVIIK